MSGVRRYCRSGPRVDINAESVPQSLDGRGFLIPNESFLSTGFWGHTDLGTRRTSWGRDVRALSLGWGRSLVWG